MGAVNCTFYKWYQQNFSCGSSHVYYQNNITTFPNLTFFRYNKLSQPPDKLVISKLTILRVVQSMVTHGVHLKENWLSSYGVCLVAIESRAFLKLHQHHTTTPPLLHHHSIICYTVLWVGVGSKPLYYLLTLKCLLLYYLLVQNYQSCGFAMY